QVIGQSGIHNDGQVVIDQHLAGVELTGIVEDLGKIRSHDGARAAITLSFRDGPVHGAVESRARRGGVAQGEFDSGGETGAVVQYVQCVNRLARFSGSGEITFGID